MRQLPALLLPLALVAGCADPGTTVADTGAGVSKGVVRQVLRSKVPGGQLLPYTDCVIAGATADEAAAIAAGQNVGAVVSGILGRPATGQCVAQKAATRVITRKVVGAIL